MPTLLNLEGFKFFFYANEHEPKHIHVMKGGDYAKIELGSLRVVNSTFKPQEIRRALEITHQYQANFLEKWNEYFNCR
ncbi:MAG: DUF4160 domain-containing protein [Methylococcaceae bacterium]|nr:DUF4160 domain-containing protein [Methylococcaceae bacterium]